LGWEEDIPQVTHAGAKIMEIRRKPFEETTLELG
jgi:hypothetical protein